MPNTRLSPFQPLRVILIGVVMSVVAAGALYRSSRTQVTRSLNQQSAEIESGINTRIEAYLAILRGVSGLFAVDRDVTRDEFRRFVANIGVDEHYPGIQGVGWTVRLNAAEVPGFLERVRRDFWPNFRIWPEEPRPEYHTILYLEPQDVRNRTALGYDMHTEANRRDAMDRARDTGAPAVTRRVTLVQEIEAKKQAGFLLYLPFYQDTETPGTIAERRARLQGHVYAPFRAGDFIDAVAAERAARGVAIALYDANDAAHGLDRWLHRDAEFPTEGAPGAIRVVRHLRVADQVWTLMLATSGPNLLPPIGVLLLGLSITGGMAMLARRESRAVTRAERSEAETRLREAELSLLVESVPVVITHVDREGAFRLCNSRLRDWFGIDPAAVVGRRINDVAGPRVVAEVEPLMQRAMRGEGASFERWIDSPGGARYLLSVLVPHRTPTGELNGFFTVTSDLTPHKRAEESARFVADCGKLMISSLDFETTSRNLVRLAVPRIADVAALFRAEGEQLRLASVAHVDGDRERSIGELFGRLEVRVAELQQFGWATQSEPVLLASDVLPGTIEQLVTDPEQRTMLHGLDLISSLHVPVMVRGKIWAILSFATTRQSGRRYTEGDRSLADEVSTRMRLAVENALLYAEAQQEIEERRRAQRSARETEERFRLLVDAATDYAIILLHLDGRIASWNNGAQRILGFTEAEALGMPFARLFSGEDDSRGVPAAELEKARQEGSAPDERWYVRQDGTRFWASGHTVALRDDEENLRGYAKIMRDLTQRKLSEQELEFRVQERTLELNEAVQELEAFSYSVSHDLRAPLRSIRGFTELTLEEAGPRLNDAERGYLGRVQRAVTRLDQLISDLLAYTRVSKTRVELGPVDLHALVADLRREHPEFQLPHADVRVEGKLPPVIGNVAYLTQALTNLLGNAVKFVRPGQRPEVRIWAETQRRMVRMYIRDRGIGIPPDKLNRVFEMFERLHVGAGYEGTGVGLAIVRRAVQRMKGAVGVESQPDEGTTFWIDLPAVET